MTTITVTVDDQLAKRALQVAADRNTTLVAEQSFYGTHTTELNESGESHVRP